MPSTWNKKGGSFKVDPATASHSPNSVISPYGGYVEPVPEAKFHNAGMRNYHHPRHYVSGTQHDDAFYSTSALAAQEGPRRGTSPGGRYSDDLQYQQMQQAQQMQETYQQPRRPSMQRPPHLNVRGNPVTPPDSERSSRTSPHSERGRSNQPWPDSARSERSDPDRASRGHFRPALQSGSAPGAVPLETSSQVYGLHAAFGDLEPAAGGDASDRSFREIGVPSASYNDPLRRGVVVPGYAGHKPGEIQRHGSAPTFVPPRNAYARSPGKNAREGRPTMSYMDHARTSEAKMPLAEDRTDHYLQAVGGVMPGFAGHVPNSQTHFGSKHLGGVNDPQAAANTAQHGAAQRHHSPSKLDYWSHEPAKDGYKRAVSAVPGYAGHLKGDAEAFGASYYSSEKPTRVMPSRPASAGQQRSQQPFASGQRYPPWYKDQAAVEPGNAPGRPPAPRAQMMPPSQASPGDHAASSPAGRPTIHRSSDPSNLGLGARRNTDASGGSRNLGETPNKAREWVPPAGLTYENAQRGLGLNLWEQRPDEYSA